MQYSYEELFSQVTRVKYFELWQKLFDCERETEALRKNLLRNPYFDLQKAFKAVDVRNKGSFTIEDVRGKLFYVIL